MDIARALIERSFSADEESIYRENIRIYRDDRTTVDVAMGRMLKNKRMTTNSLDYT